MRPQQLADADDNFSGLPLSIVRRIDELADHYEAAYLSGKAPDLRSYVEQLSEISEEARAALAAHLEKIQSELDSSNRAATTLPVVSGDLNSPRANTTAAERDSLPDALSMRASSGAPPQRRIELGDRPVQVGEYRLLEQLGAGGMGVVYKALHVRLQRPVAMKFPRFAGNLDPQSAARFFREARLIGRLQHPHIVLALDAGDSSFGPYLVTEFIEGETLESLVRRGGPLPIEQAVEWAAQAASALEFAHGQGIVHRDVKPSNILLDGDGRLRVVDFGLAKLLAEEQPGRDGRHESDETQHGTFLGTVGYAAPEQLRSRTTIDGRADIYALGCVLYFMLTGEPLHKGTLADRVLAGRELNAATLREAIGVVPRPFERIWCRMVAAAPQQRPPSMTEVESALREALASGLDATRQKVPPRRMVLASLVCLAVGGLAWWGVRGESMNRLLLGTNLRPTGPPPLSAVAPFDAAQAASHQSEWAKHFGIPVRMVNTADIPFVLLPPGEFLMGLSKDPVSEPALPVDNWRYRNPDVVRQEQLPRHQVVLTKPIYFGATEVTNAQFRRFVDATGYVTDAERTAGWGKEDRGWLKRAGYSWKNMGQRLCEDDHCVINVTWNDASALCKWLTETDKRGTYRLPTEAEWEFACRAGSTTNYWFGNDAAELVDHAWFAGNSGGRFQPVGRKQPNPFGIYDMYGNRQEWCLDNYAANFYGVSPLENPVCETGDSQRIARGGAHTDLASFCTSSQRWSQQADNPGAAGIRIVCELKYEP